MINSDIGNSSDLSSSKQEVIARIDETPYMLGARIIQEFKASVTEDYFENKQADPKA